MIRVSIHPLYLIVNEQLRVVWLNNHSDNLAGDWGECTVQSWDLWEQKKTESKIARWA